MTRLVRPSGDAGVSLAELLVAMMVLGLLLTMTGGFVVSAYRANATNTAVDRTTRQASTAMAQMARMVRAASTYDPPGGGAAQAPFVTTTADEVTLYAYVNLEDALEKPVKVQFKVEGTKLVERRWASSPSANNPDLYVFSPTVTSTTVLTDALLPVAQRGPVLFTYLKADRTTSATSVADVAAVRIDLQVGTGADLARSTFLTNTVGVTNVASQGTP